jgi:linoleoyl-CoA desaturase
LSLEAAVVHEPIKFPSHSPLHAALKARVDAYFRGSGRRTDGGVRLTMKTVFVFAWLATSYAALVFWAPNWWVAGILAALVGLAVAGVGFNVQHDGGHDAYGSSGWTNKLSAYALDIVGGSSYVWRFKHVAIHHQFTNVADVDDDIDGAPFLRLSPEQPRRWYHRLQHWYAWLLFGFISPKWAFYDDFHSVATGRIGTQRFPRPKGADLVLLFAGKIVFVGWVFALPLAVGHSIGGVLLTYAFASFVAGVTLSVVFQLAHCVDKADFPGTPPGGRLARPWAEHQLATTVDFAPKNRLLCWYLGGLNFQVEHHLFPRVSHVHYPAIAPIVRETCTEYGVPHLCHHSFFSAIGSHMRHLRDLGRADRVPASGNAR